MTDGMNLFFVGFLSGSAAALFAWIIGWGISHVKHIIKLASKV